MSNWARVVLMMAVVLAVASPAAAWPWAPAPGPATSTSTSPDLEYYVQVIIGAPYTGVLVAPLNSSYTASFGDMEAFTFNVTKEAANTSQLLGYVRGYTVQVSSTSTSHEIEVEVVSYDDGAGLNGTISLQGLINRSTNEIAIVGGSGSFRGVRGYVIISMVWEMLRAERNKYQSELNTLNVEYLFLQDKTSDRGAELVAKMEEAAARVQYKEQELQKFAAHQDSLFRLGAISRTMYEFSPDECARIPGTSIEL